MPVDDSQEQRKKKKKKMAFTKIVTTSHNIKELKAPMGILKLARKQAETDTKTQFDPKAKIKPS